MTWPRSPIPNPSPPLSLTQPGQPPFCSSNTHFYIFLPQDFCTYLSSAWETLPPVPHLLGPRSPIAHSITIASTLTHCPK